MKKVSFFAAETGNICDLMSDTFRFQEQSACKTALPFPESEEEYDQEDEASDKKSGPSVESTDGEMLLSVASGSNHCKKNS